MNDVCSVLPVPNTPDLSQVALHCVGQILPSQLCFTYDKGWRNRNELKFMQRFGIPCNLAVNVCKIAVILLGDKLKEKCFVLPGLYNF